MSYRNVVDESPVPTEVGVSIDEVLPIKPELRIESLLLAIIDRLDGILYVMHAGYLEAEEEPDEIAH